MLETKRESPGWWPGLLYFSTTLMVARWAYLSCQLYCVLNERDRWFWGLTRDFAEVFGEYFRWAGAGNRGRGAKRDFRRRGLPGAPGRVRVGCGRFRRSGRVRWGGGLRSEE